MTATWTTPKTWNTGDPLTALDMNTHIRDNFEFVKSPPTDDYKVDELADYSTTSTSFVNVDGTKLVLTIITAGGLVLCGFSGSVTINANARFCLDVEVDGVRYSADDGILVQDTTTSKDENASFVIPILGLAAGSHTFKLQWKCTAGTMYMWAGAGTTGGRDVHPMFWVREVS